MQQTCCLWSLEDGDVPGASLVSDGHGVNRCSERLPGVDEAQLWLSSTMMFKMERGHLFAPFSFFHQTDQPHHHEPAHLPTPLPEEPISFESEKNVSFSRSTGRVWLLFQKKSLPPPVSHDVKVRIQVAARTIQTSFVDVHVPGKKRKPLSGLDFSPEFSRSMAPLLQLPAF